MIIKELLEKLDEALFQLKENAIYLYEMSQPQGKVRNNIRNLSTSITNHLVKVILYGKEEKETLHHWSHEINNWLIQCMKTKIKRRTKDTYPTEQELYKWLTDYYSDTSDMTGIKKVWDHEYTYQGHESRQTITDEQLYTNYLGSLKELCHCVCINENTDDKVQEILEKYLLG